MKASELKDRDPVIVDAVRTPVGKRGGALSHLHASALLAHTIAAIVDRNGLDRAAVDDVVAGCATQVGEQAGNVARTALLMAGFPFTSVPILYRRYVVHFADNMIRAGACDIVVACGVELMSHTQGGNEDTTFGRRYPPDLVERFSMPTMGIAAERIADRWNLDRGYLDELSLRSHMLASQAQESGRFAAEWVAVADASGAPVTRDEGVRPNASAEKLATLKPAFREGGRVTAGNASQVSDGASALLLTTAAKARELGLRPRARLHAQLVVGVDPQIMLTGPIPATHAILAKSGLALGDIDRFEINEAFASVLGAWLKETGAPLDRVNVNGGSIAMGHPLGSTGARLMSGLLHELERTGGRYGLQSMCCGGGLGTATIVERLD